MNRMDLMRELNETRDLAVAAYARHRQVECELGISLCDVHEKAGQEHDEIQVAGEIRKFDHDTYDALEPLITDLVRDYVQHHSIDAQRVLAGLARWGGVDDEWTDRTISRALSKAGAQLIHYTELGVVSLYRGPSADAIEEVRQRLYSPQRKTLRKLHLGLWE